jgi:hypothetical protein
MGEGQIFVKPRQGSGSLLANTSDGMEYWSPPWLGLFQATALHVIKAAAIKPPLSLQMKYSARIKDCTSVHCAHYLASYLQFFMIKLNIDIYMRIKCRWSALKMEAICSSETLVSTYKSTQYYNPEDQHYLHRNAVITSDLIKEH